MPKPIPDCPLHDPHKPGLTSLGLKAWSDPGIITLSENKLFYTNIEERIWTNLVYPL